MKEKASQKSIKQLKYQFFIQYKNEWKEILMLIKILIILTLIKMDSKQAFDLNLVNISKIVISDKLKHSHKGFKYFIGYKDDNIVRWLCIIFHQMSGYIKYSEN